MGKMKKKKVSKNDEKRQESMTINEVASIEGNKVLN